ncbi:MAG: polyprenyl diphosphate synthase [Gammaproteobacteria bacterium]
MLPRHVAVIMDGNGRWAERRGLTRVAGHEEGIKAVEKIIKAAIESKIKILTLFAFGIENWGRPADEVNFLMQLFVKNLDCQAEAFIKNDIRLKVIGDKSRIAPQICDKIDEIEKVTAHHQTLTLIIAFNYSGRWDILQAVQQVAEKVAQGKLQPQDIQYQTLQDALSIADLPEPDLFIRTSGEQRISNFMLWQFAYTELYFTETLWPDFDADCFAKALLAFSKRQRRYGLISEPAKSC